MKTTWTEAKAAVAATLGVLTAWLGILAMPLYILVGLGFLDYITGYLAAPHRGQQRKSETAFGGIVKKVCTWLVVALGSVLDWVVAYAGDTVGLRLPVEFLVAALVAVWLICNEVISILENIGDLGVDLPPFLIALVSWVRAGAQHQGEAPRNDPGEKKGMSES